MENKFRCWFPYSIGIFLIAARVGVSLVVVEVRLDRHCATSLHHEDVIFSFFYMLEIS